MPRLLCMAIVAEKSGGGVVSGGDGSSSGGGNSGGSGSGGGAPAPPVCLSRCVDIEGLCVYPGPVRAARASRISTRQWFGIFYTQTHTWLDMCVSGALDKCGHVLQRKPTTGEKL
ncbi:hypothetical protein SARC_13803 [Sphaeroforma arctica JP610]|uniref:Uncharacterized protein n=1 Tax=Sphaeroforma arctica JP610 TaxID=667725 RepID=A0A0L0FA83_9EUKA|nr:hypothetical protein SARC_13803 [Sphaeroforma arctica JP610]KNC73639.1 hypothetical protein SARC_13803 [Sphaeroforma arctica JP610]|eukprot:XP_014147541.1 hypothetical protein SARC_13803 [Sphaeroforma arctica JP610]